mgnify:FL=1
MSTLLADTIRKTGGTAGVDIRVKNTSVYESDGGTSVTQNLVQGVAKAFIFCDNITAVKSFNMTGTTDHGTGNYTYTFTNNMSDANWLISHEAGLEGATYGLYLEDSTTGKTSSTIRFQTMSISNTLQDAGEVQQICFGDLA